jgi:hypothetical protein
MKAGEDFCITVAGMYTPRLVYYEIRLTESVSSSAEDETAIAIVPPTKGDANWNFAVYPQDVEYAFRWTDESPGGIVDLLESMAAQFEALPDGASTKPIIDAFLASVAML